MKKILGNLEIETNEFLLSKDMRLKNLKVILNVMIPM